MKKLYLILTAILFLTPVFVFAQEDCSLSLANLDDCQDSSVVSIKNINYPVEELNNCQNQEECRIYCDRLENLEQCYNYSKKNNFVAKCELEKVEKILNTIKSGINLPSCRTKAECKEYCSKEENLDECLYFAQSAGFMSKEQAFLLRKTRAKGPGDVKEKKIADFIAVIQII